MKLTSRKIIDKPKSVYNLHVKENHNYFVEDLLVSNCHGAKAEVIKDLICVHGKHISHRYGCTGTFPKPKTDQYTLKTSIGTIVREVRAKWLIEQGYLSEIQIDPIETIDEDPEMPDYASEKSYLTQFTKRNQGIANYIKSLRDTYGNTMVLVNTTSLPQGREIAEMIEDAVYLDGGSKTELRQEQYQKYADQDGMIIIASAGIASTGISIDRIFCLVLLDTGKSFVKCIQSVGRGLRKKGDKSKIHVADIYSKLKYAKKHFRERKTYYLEAEYPLNPVKKLKY